MYVHKRLELPVRLKQYHGEYVEPVHSTKRQSMVCLYATFVSEAVPLASDTLRVFLSPPAITSSRTHTTHHMYHIMHHAHHAHYILHRSSCQLYPSG